MLSGNSNNRINSSKYFLLSAMCCRFKYSKTISNIWRRIIANFKILLICVCKFQIDLCSINFFEWLRKIFNFSNRSGINICKYYLRWVVTMLYLHNLHHSSCWRPQCTLHWTHSRGRGGFSLGLLGPWCQLPLDSRYSDSLSLVSSSSTLQWALFRLPSLSLSSSFSFNHSLVAGGQSLLTFAVSLQFFLACFLCVCVCVFLIE